MTVIQSYRLEGGADWVYACMHSVRSWAESKGFNYRVYHDEEVLAVLPGGALDKIGERWAILTDYARLAFSEAVLDEDEEVLWVDADVFLHAPKRMRIPEDTLFSFGAEMWVDEDLRVRRGIHNAYAYFKRGNPFLVFYRYACERLISEFSGTQMVPQFLGPKLLKHYDNLLNLPKVETIVMLSPTVATALLENDASVISLQRDLPQAAGVNLCNSLISEKQAEMVIEKLKSLALRH